MSTEVKISERFIYVDRRATGRDKSLPNRQRLLRRIQDSIKTANPNDIDAAGVGGASGAPGKQLANPIKIARKALAEPSFRYSSGTGEIDVVLPGNDRWLKGDVFPVESPSSGRGSGGSGEGAGPGDSSEDDFIVNISRSEFYDAFFGDCELPDLEQTAQKELPEAVSKPAGFQKEGNPGQLSVVRSYKNSMGRRKALTADSRAELEELEARLEDLMHSNDCEIEGWAEQLRVVTERITELKAKVSAVPFFEKLDLRYRKSEKVMVKSADAVLIMAMDISGSMGEEEKRIARKFFSLQYAFIKMKYPNTDLVFIYHTDEAEEVNEEEFFTSRKSGGTIISPAVALANKIVKDRYDVNATNLYFSYAGDGDNWESDNAALITEFEENGFLNKVRHAVYAQVGTDRSNSWYGTGPSKTWTTISSIANSNKKMKMAKIQTEADVFSAFKKIYTKQKSTPKSTGKR